MFCALYTLMANFRSGGGGDDLHSMGSRVAYMCSGFVLAMSRK